jgi:cellulose synthase/poly-beta-1,6-N-acetylglucosamine synthase-like glycosyltransferase
MPSVTIQIPVYNEGRLAGGAVEAAAALDSPADKFEVLILDGSTDDTPELLAPVVERCRAAGINVRHHRRDNSKGFKAGALIEGCEMARGDLIAIFDADFCPGRDFLRRTIGHFADPRLGCLQTRWDHRNAEASLLTAGQAIILDAFHGVEAPARSGYNLVTMFFGTCGIWRKSCIEDCGGWQTDTLAEDMDLSIQAQLRGWRVVFDGSVATAGELPESMDGYLRQQHRWTMGHAQVARKLFGPVCRSCLPLGKKVETVLHLFRWLTFPCLLVMALLMVPVLVLNPELKQFSPLESLVGLLILCLGTGAASIFYVMGQTVLHPRSWWRAVLYIPVLVGMGLALAPNNCRAIVQAALGRKEPFRKTPRVGEGPVRLRGVEGYVALVNLAVGLYLAVSAVVTVIVAVRIEAWSFLITAAVLALFAMGLLAGAYASFRDGRAAAQAAAGRLQSPGAAELARPSV